MKRTVQAFRAEITFISDPCVRHICACFPAMGLKDVLKTVIRSGRDLAVHNWWLQRSPGHLPQTLTAAVKCINLFFLLLKLSVSFLILCSPIYRCCSFFLPVRLSFFLCLLIYFHLSFFLFVFFCYFAFFLPFFI